GVVFDWSCLEAWIVVVLRTRCMWDMRRSAVGLAPGRGRAAQACTIAITHIAFNLQLVDVLEERYSCHRALPLLVAAPWE
ncbi:MAG: hypothetical protein ACKPKO_11165, partial [Candidatus Fonsibacter sp.]